MIWSIYYLSIGEKDIFYVGLSRQYLGLRLSAHISDGVCGHGDNFEKNDIVSKNANNIQIHEVEEIECNKQEALSKELYWIHQFKSWGFNLTNKQGIPKAKSDRSIMKYKSILVEEKFYDEFSEWCKKNGRIRRLVTEIAIKNFMKV